MDDSQVPGCARVGSAFNGMEIPVRTTPGAVASRVVHASGQAIAEHRHDWACITLPVIGHGTEEYDGGTAALSAPAGVVHPAGSAHADAIAPVGLETVSVQFDPSWLRLAGFELGLGRSVSWHGGAAGAAGLALAAAWTSKAVRDDELAAVTARFLHLLNERRPDPAPAWLPAVAEAARGEQPPTTRELAQRLNLNTAWLARAFRCAWGEGLQEFTRRKRVERAAHLIRSSDHPLAEIAAACGFCDQAHMNRNFRAVLGRSPSQIRTEWRANATS